MRRAFTLALCSLLLAGCFTRGIKPDAKGDGGLATPSQSARTIPGPVQVAGRVAAVDLRSLTVIVELAPYTAMPGNFNGSTLIARRDDLKPTARLQASPYLRGRTFGARLLAGQPQVGDEVVFAPASP
jgi:hypothetical protein